MTVNYFVNKPPDIFNFNKLNKLNHKAGATLGRMKDFSLGLNKNFNQKGEDLTVLILNNAVPN